MLKNVLFLIGSILTFTAGIIGYGFILNISEPSLSEVLYQKDLDYLTNVSVVIHKQKYKLELYSDTLLIKSYRAVFGKSSSAARRKSYKNVTPSGTYQVCSIDTNSRYEKFFTINYPNERDLRGALRLGYISNNEYNIMINNLENSECPSDSEKFEMIGIHGIGQLNFIFKNLPFVFNWTNGSIAISNESINELYSVITVGTKIVIKD